MILPQIPVVFYKMGKVENSLKNLNFTCLRFYAQFLLFDGFRIFDKLLGKASIQAIFQHIRLCLALNLASVKSDDFLKP